MKKAKTWTLELSIEWIDEKLEREKKKFARTNRAQLVSFRTWCEEWDWAQRSDVYTHLLHAYPAKLLAYVPIAFLTSSLVAPEDLIMDSFAGTGTVLLESMVHKFRPRSCYGVEINPLARLIAKVKTTPLPVGHLNTLADQLYKFIAATPTAPIPDFESRDFWFRKAAQQDLARIRYCIEHLEATADEKDFFRVCFSAIIRDMSRADPDIAPPVLLNPEKFPKERQAEIHHLLRRKQKANAILLFRKKVSANLERMKDFVKALAQLPVTRSNIIWDDAREIKLGRYIESGKIDKSNAQVLEKSVGMVITSPPYVAAQKYIRTTKLELLWLGLASESDVRNLNRSITGTERVPWEETREFMPIGKPTVDSPLNRVYRSTAKRVGISPRYYWEETREFIPVGNSTADSLLKRVYRSNPERAAIGSRYYRDMRNSLIAIHKALKPNGICVLVVGNNTIDGHTAYNHSILSEIAGEGSRFSTEVILRDPIRSRGLITKRHDTAGVIDDEYVVVLRKQAKGNSTRG